MAQPSTPFPPFEIAIRILVATGTGLLVGFEREWAHKEIGSRTFTIVSLFGALAALISPGLTVTGLVGVIALIVVAGIRNIARGQEIEPTTSAALLAMYILGVLAGQGHVFTPAASAILMTLMLSLKPQLTRFAIGLKQEEVRAAVLLALIAFVIYPVLPNRLVDPWRLFNPRELWLTIVLIAAIGFVNYVLLRLFSARGLYYTAVLGGLVNSTATIAELAPLVDGSGANPTNIAMVVNQLTNVAMFARNLVLLTIFSPAAGLIAVWPIAIMAGAATYAAWRGRARALPSPGLNLGSPLQISKVARFGALFLLIQAAAALGARIFGASGIVIVSALGGLASSASSTAAAGTLATTGHLSPSEAALCTVAASIASMLVNLPIVYRHFRNRRMIGKFALISAAVALLGIVATIGAMREF